MKDEPDGRKHLAGNGNLYFHFVLSANNGLMVAEFVVKAVLCFAGRPSAFNECFPQVFVSMSDLSGLYLAGTFLVAGLQATLGYKMGSIFKR